MISAPHPDLGFRSTARLSLLPPGRPSHLILGTLSPLRLQSRERGPHLNRRRKRRIMHTVCNERMGGGHTTWDLARVPYLLVTKGSIQCAFRRARRKQNKKPLKIQFMCVGILVFSRLFSFDGAASGVSARRGKKTTKQKPVRGRSYTPCTQLADSRITVHCPHHTESEAAVLYIKGRDSQFAGLLLQLR